MEHRISELVEGLTAVSQTLDETARQKLYNSLQHLSWALETPYDAIQRLAYSNIMVPALSIGVDLKLFEVLGASESPLTSGQLADRLGADKDLVDRFCRYFAGQGVIQEVGAHEWKANTLVKTLAKPDWAGLVKHYSDYMGPIWSNAPKYLRDHKYAKIDNSSQTGFQSAFHTDQSPFVWMAGQPDLLKATTSRMIVAHDSQPGCFDLYPLRAKTENLAPDQPFFVDVGGGAGQQAIVVRGILPDLPNKIIDEDLQYVLADVNKHAGVEYMAQNFFEPQQIKHARIYYFRNIFHDWRDEESLEILKKTKEVFAPDSIILIDDMVLPERNVPWQATQLDLTMMLALGAHERSTEQWTQLITAAGLRISKVHSYIPGVGESLLECVVA